MANRKKRRPQTKPTTAAAASTPTPTKQVAVTVRQPWGRPALAVLVGAGVALQIAAGIAFWIANRQLGQELLSSILLPVVVVMPATVAFEPLVRRVMGQRRLGFLEALSVGAMAYLLISLLSQGVGALNSPSQSSPSGSSPTPSASATAAPTPLPATSNSAKPSLAPASTPLAAPSIAASPSPSQSASARPQATSSAVATSPSPHSSASPSPSPNSVSNGVIDFSSDDKSNRVLGEIIGVLLTIFGYSYIFKFLFAPNPRAGAGTPRNPGGRRAAPPRKR